jgi:hypothetical protein
MFYCLVQNNAVTQGPIPLPTSFGNITGFNLVPDPTIYGWYPYSDPGQPAYDGSTQSLVRSFTIDNNAKTVTQAYAVEALPLAQIQQNQAWLIQQSQSANLKRKATKAAASGDTNTAVQYLLQNQRNFP